ncbi:MAG: hypothetical protein ACRC9Q_03200 [Bacteroidales bacterium]
MKQISGWFLFLISLFIFSGISAHNIKQTFSRLSSDSMNTLREEYGKNKVYPQEYEEQFLIALSHFPQLKEVHIHLIFDHEKTTMSARPKIASLFCKDRKYNIRINNAKSFEGILLEDVPFNAQIGVIGHELAHIVDYEQKSFAQIIGTGLGYLTGKYKRRLEHYIDNQTIMHGLGWQLLEWAQYSMHEDNASEKYIQFKKRVYMLPEKILTVIETKSNRSPNQVGVKL